MGYPHYYSNQIGKKFGFGVLNLPSEITIKEGARVMFLTNKLLDKGLCNGSIGVITKLIDENHIEVAFPVKSGINQVIVEKITAYFNLNGAAKFIKKLHIGQDMKPMLSSVLFSNIFIRL